MVEHSPVNASQGTEGPSPVEAAQVKTVESPQTEHKDPSPVHTATGEKSSAKSTATGNAEPAKSPTTGNAESTNTPATGDAESNATHFESATDVITAE